MDADLATLRRVAFDAGYRMLGTRSDAEDVAQEALLRVQDAVQRGEVRNAEAYTTTVATRLAIDHLRSARVRRESYHGPWLPEPIIDRSAADDVEVADSVSYALLVVLERLAPLERAAFLLREVFGFSYGDVADALDRTEPAVRQLVSRARRRIDEGRPRLVPDAEEHRTLVGRFLDAATGGDLDGLLSLLTDEVRLVSDGGAAVHAARRPILGADRVARFVRKVARRWQDVRIATVNGEPGFTVGRPALVGTVVAEGGRITAIHWVLNPDKLPR
jgi:RNA polymerase sigma-70 factor, ECF subfamily